MLQLPKMSFCCSWLVHQTMPLLIFTTWRLMRGFVRCNIVEWVAYTLMDHDFRVVQFCTHASCLLDLQKLPLCNSTKSMRTFRK